MSTVDDRRHNSILSTPHQNSSQILHHLDNVGFSRHYDNVHKLPPPLSGSKLYEGTVWWFIGVGGGEYK